MRVQTGIDSATEIERILYEAIPGEKRRAILDVLVEKAIAGDGRVAMYLLDRLYGRVAPARGADAAREPEKPDYDYDKLSDAQLEKLMKLLEICSTDE